MQEFHGAIGFVDSDRRRWRPLSKFTACYVLLQVGNGQQWSDVGIVVFDEYGRQKAWKVDGLEVGRVEMDMLQKHIDAGYPLEQRPNFPMFLGHVADSLSDIVAVEAMLFCPVQFPWITDNKCIRVTSPIDAQVNDNIPPAWRALLV